MGVPGKGRPKGARDKVPRLPVRPELRCTAVSKQRGDQCRNAAAFGAFVCLTHGAQAPQVLDGARRRIEGLVPIALVRLGQLLESTNDAVALAASRDLLDRIGARTPAQLELSGTVDHVVTTPEVQDLLAGLAAHKALAGPSKEERIVAALAEQLGVPDADYATQLAAVFDATVPTDGEPVGPQRHVDREPVPGSDVEDAVVVPEVPRALPPARPRPDPVETITIANGQTWPSAALSPGGSRSSGRP